MLLERSIAWIAATAVSSLLALVYSVVLNRGLGPAGRGTFAVFLTVVNFSASVLALGTGIVARAEAGQRPHNASRIHTALLIWALGAGVVAGVLMALARQSGLATEALLPARPVLIAASVAALAYLTQWQLLSQAIGRYRAINLQRIARASLELGAIATGFALLQAVPPVAMWTWLTAAAAASALAFWQFPAPRLAADTHEALRRLRSFLAPGLRVTIGAQAIGLQAPLILFLLAASCSKEEVGQYAVAFGLAMQLGALAGSLAVVSVDQLASSERRVAEERALLLSRIYWSAVVPAAVAVAALAPWVLTRLYGEAFRAAALLLPILLAGFLASQATEGYSQFLMAQYQAFRLCAVMNLLSLLGLVAIGPALIHSFGAPGAAASMALAYGGTAVAYTVVGVKRMGRGLREGVLLGPGDAHLLGRRWRAARLIGLGAKAESGS